MIITIFLLPEMHTEEDMQYIQGISWQTVFFQTHAKVSKMTLSFAVDTGCLIVLWSKVNITPVEKDQQFYWFMASSGFRRFGNHEISCWILAPFLSEAVEVSECNFFENWLMKHKSPNLLKPLGTIIQQNYWSFYPSEPFSFNMIHPVWSRK